MKPLRYAEKVFSFQQLSVIAAFLFEFYCKRYIPFLPLSEHENHQNKEFSLSIYMIIFILLRSFPPLLDISSNRCVLYTHLFIHCIRIHPKYHFIKKLQFQLNASNRILRQQLFSGSLIIHHILRCASNRISCISVKAKLFSQLLFLQKSSFVMRIKLCTILSLNVIKIKRRLEYGNIYWANINVRQLYV